jgi:hypothetical protein
MKAMKISREKLMEATKMSRGTDGHYEDQRRVPGGHKDEQRGLVKAMKMSKDDLMGALMNLRR